MWEAYRCSGRERIVTPRCFRELCCTSLINWLQKWFLWCVQTWTYPKGSHWSCTAYMLYLIVAILSFLWRKLKTSASSSLFFHIQSIKKKSCWQRNCLLIKRVRLSVWQEDPSGPVSPPTASWPGATRLSGIRKVNFRCLKIGKKKSIKGKTESTLITVR